MSTYTDASLIVTPNAKKAGKLYSLKGADLDAVRATTATYVGSDGLNKTALANEPRFDYTNGSCPSILVEPQRTNLFLRSEEFNDSYWSKLNITVTPNASISPKNDSTADLLTPIGTGLLRRIYGSITAGTYTCSIYLKSNTGSSFNTRLAFRDSVNNITQIENITVLTEWKRFSITFTTSGTTGFEFWIGGAGTLDTGKNLLAWGAQLEAGANATSYIPTVASTVTRNADVISKSGISSLIGQTEGTIFLDLYSPFDGTSKEISLSDGTLNNRIAIGYLNTANRFTLQVVKAGVSQVSNTFIPINQDITNKIILSYSLNNYRLFINGVLVFTDNVAEVFTNELSIFQLNRSIAQNPYFGRINSIQLYKTAFTDEQCIALTTL